MDVHTVKEYEGMQLFMTDDGLSGFARDADELVSVFSSVKRRSPAIVQQAVAQGAKRLNCYAIPSESHPEGYLPYLYSKGGFVEVARVTIKPALDPPRGSTNLAVMARTTEGPVPEPPLFGPREQEYFDALGYRDFLRNREAGTQETLSRRGTAPALTQQPAWAPSTVSSAADMIRKMDFRGETDESIEEMRQNFQEQGDKEAVETLREIQKKRIPDSWKGDDSLRSTQYDE